MADRTIKRGSTGVILRIPVGASSSADLIASGTQLTMVVWADGDVTPTVYTGSAFDNTIEAIAALGTYVAPSSGKARAGGPTLTYGSGTNYSPFLELQLENLWFAKAGRGISISLFSVDAFVGAGYRVALSDLDVENGEAKVKDWSLSAITTNITGTLSGAVGSISGITFPAHFADMAITATTGKVTVGTNSDKAGYTDVPGPSFLPPR